MLFSSQWNFFRIDFWMQLIFFMLKCNMYTLIIVFFLQGSDFFFCTVRRRANRLSDNSHLDSPKTDWSKCFGENRYRGGNGIYRGWLLPDPSHCYHVCSVTKLHCRRSQTHVASTRCEICGSKHKHSLVKYGGGKVRAVSKCWGDTYTT